MSEGQGRVWRVMQRGFTGQAKEEEGQEMRRGPSSRGPRLSLRCAGRGERWRGPRDGLGNHCMLYRGRLRIRWRVMGLGSLLEHCETSQARLGVFAGNLVRESDVGKAQNYDELAGGSNRRRRV